MKILIITTYFPPLNSVASLRPYSWAKYWAKAGHEVTVLTTPKDKDRHEAFNLPFDGFSVVEIAAHPLYYKLRRLYRDSNVKEVRNGSIKQSEKNNTMMLKLMMKLYDFLAKRGTITGSAFPSFEDLWMNNAKKWVISHGKWDLAVSTAWPYTVHVIANALKHRGIAKNWVADYRDLWVGNHLHKGLLPTYDKYLERKLMKNSELISTVSEPLGEVLASRYGKDKVAVIENGFDPDDYNSLRSHNTTLSAEKVNIVYTGTIYKYRDPSPLLKAIRNMASTTAHTHLLQKLRVIFAGPNVRTLQSMVEAYHVENWIELKGFVPQEESLMMQRDAHILLHLEHEDEKVKGILTGKLFEYLRSGTKIWALGVTDHTSVGKIIHHTHTGLALGKDVARIESELIKLLTSEKKEKPATHWEVVNQYSRKSLAEKYLARIMGQCNLPVASF